VPQGYVLTLRAEPMRLQEVKSLGDESLYARPPEKMRKMDLSGHRTIQRTWYGLLSLAPLDVNSRPDTQVFRTSHAFACSFLPSTRLAFGFTTAPSFPCCTFPSCTFVYRFHALGTFPRNLWVQSGLCYMFRDHMSEVFPRCSRSNLVAFSGHWRSPLS
jgi:hypothetical protein